jgi:hypothetical protein
MAEFNSRSRIGLVVDNFILRAAEASRRHEPRLQTVPRGDAQGDSLICDHILVHNPIWVWSKILDGDSNIPQDYGIYAYFSNHFPFFMLEDEHRSSMGEESLHHLSQMLCKYYVAKVLRSKRKNENKLWWEEKKSKEKRKKKQKRKREKWEEIK